MPGDFIIGVDRLAITQLTLTQWSPLAAYLRASVNSTINFRIAGEEYLNRLTSCPGPSNDLVRLSSIQF